MKTVRSYVQGRWHEAADRFTELIDPCSEAPIAKVSSEGVDFEAALSFARTTGQATLRELDLGQRGELLASMARALHQRRDELIKLSLLNTGTTRKDAKFDIDGATYVLSHYAELGRELGDAPCVVDGEGTALGRSARFWGQHVWLPLEGAAVLVNAFNFPAWGLAEKAACALLAGVPVIAKPATSSALVTERCVEILVEADVLPPGALSLICGSPGDLLRQLGGQDVLAFTGSADTALRLRGLENLLSSSTRVNIEADSLNAAVLAPDVEPGGESWLLFVREVVREITQKTGQKCTAVRRIFVPRERIDAVQEALCEALSDVVTGNPEDGSVTMGPLATAQQLQDAVAGVARLSSQARRVLGSGQRVDGVGNEAGSGFFLQPTLLRADEPESADLVHEHEVFAPVSTLMPYDGSARAAAELVGRGGGCLVTSVYGDDVEFLADFLIHGGSTSGRIYIGSEKVAGQLPGSGAALPQVLHGGPGRAGGGTELGGLRGMQLYMQRVALTGDKALVQRLAGLRGKGMAG
jgi:oxepin-CoA hydrolase/3-oxo-5,6-dehydrosuberyl-CoA semialdehyde dehydrogenase